MSDVFFLYLAFAAGGTLGILLMCLLAMARDRHDVTEFQKSITAMHRSGVIMVPRPEPPTVRLCDLPSDVTRKATLDRADDAEITANRETITLTCDRR